ncbi:SpoIIE family protein phosphatase [Streptomyces sp. NPDC047315]|uniref:SpoIIE family protein phosphatase n=1 Tax=Streptomyces sp. NPDC047315 TaxID=3155142 RepID=UPI003400F9DF
MGITIATASRQGTGTNNADSAAAFTAADGTLAAAVVDMIGHAPTAPRVGMLCAETAVRVGSQKGALAGILAAAALVADPGAGDEPEPDGVAVLAVVEPDETRLAWVGDCVALSWNGKQLLRRSTPQSMGEFLRINDDEGRAIKHDNWVRIALSTSTATNVAVTSVPRDELLLLVSDGVVDQVEHGTLETLVLEHADNPQALVDAIVAAAEPDERGRRDDATAVVIVAFAR